MIEGKTILQISHYDGKATVMGNQEVGITVTILGDFPPISESQAESPKDDEEVEKDQLVAWYIYKQILDWYRFSYIGTWLAVGDEVSHLNGPGVFRIDHRTFTLAPRNIEFSVQFRPTE